MQPTLQQLNQETIDLTKQIFSGAAVGGVEKAGITTSLTLQGYELEGPSKKLYPVLSPLRNLFARTKSPIGSPTVNWRAITAINAALLKPSVAEGTRNSAITYTEVNRSATYKSFGYDDSISQEAVWTGRNFEDVRAVSALVCLQNTMIGEETLILGGNSSTNAFTTTGPVVTIAQASGGGAWSTNTDVYVKCVALPLYGWLNSLGTIYNNSDLTQALADHGGLSASAAHVTLTANTYTVYVSVPPFNAGTCYAWFVSTNTSASDPGDASRYLAAITTVPSASFTAAASTSNYTANNVTSDTSGDANAYDGILSQLLPQANTFTTLSSTALASGTLKILSGGTTPPNTIVFDMLNSASTTSSVGGTVLTADGAIGIKEFDLVLKTLWDKVRIGPTLIVMNSQEALSITRVLGASTSARFANAWGDKGITGGAYIQGYVNKFTGSQTPGNPDVIPFLIHPYMPPGQILFLSERLPYPNSNVANVFEVEMMQEYADYEWAMTTRAYVHGVYAMGALKLYFPAGCGMIRGIAPS